MWFFRRRPKNYRNGKITPNAAHRCDRVLYVDARGLTVGSLYSPGVPVVIGSSHQHIDYWKTSGENGVCNVCRQERPLTAFGLNYEADTCYMCGSDEVIISSSGPSGGPKELLALPASPYVSVGTISGADWFAENQINGWCTCCGQWKPVHKGYKLSQALDVHLCAICMEPGHRVCSRGR